MVQDWLKIDMFAQPVKIDEVFDFSESFDSSSASIKSENKL